MKREHVLHEERIEAARQELVSASEPQKKLVAASNFINLCRSRDPWLIAKMERERMERVKA
jgi:hypothetical protein